VPMCHSNWHAGGGLQLFSRVNRRARGLLSWRSMSRLTPLAFLLLFTAACGGQTNDDQKNTGGQSGSGGSGAVGGGGAGGSGAVGGGSGGSGAVAGSGGMPNECTVPASGPGPYATKIRFVNKSSTPIWLREDCMVRYELYSCADGYQVELPHAADCMMSCSDDFGGCIACGACMVQAHEVTPTTPVETEWSGNTYKFSTNGTGCQCYDQFAAPAGKYAIRLPVWFSEEQATSFGPSAEAMGYFELPAPNGVVEVNVEPPTM